jgi:hypothetical protein
MLISVLLDIAVLKKIDPIEFISSFFIFLRHSCFEQKNILYAPDQISASASTVLRLKRAKDMPPHRFKDVKKIGWTERSKMYLERFEE